MNIFLTSVWCGFSDEAAGTAGSASSGALCLAGGAAQVTGADSTSAAGAGAPARRAGRRRLTGSPPGPGDGGVTATSGARSPTAHISCNKGPVVPRVGPPATLSSTVCTGGGRGAGKGRAEKRRAETEGAYPPPPAGRRRLDDLNDHG